MAIKPKEILDLVKQTFSDWNEDKAPRLGAALAYYTIFSIAPLLIIVVAIAGLVFNNAGDQIIAQIRGLVGDNGADAIKSMMESANKPREGMIASGIGIATLLFGASGVFGQLQDALNTIWEVKPKPGRGVLGVLKDRFLSFTMVLGIGFLLLVSLVVTAALAALGEFVQNLGVPELVYQVLNFVVSFGIITLLFALMFKVVPDVEIAWKDVWIGAAITALLFTIGKLLIGIYLGKSSVTSSYGVAGSLVVILLWVYYSAQILFLGAEFTQVYANKYGSKVVPDADAVPVTEEARAQQGMPSKEKVEQAAAEQDGRKLGLATAAETDEERSYPLAVIPKPGTRERVKPSKLQTAKTAVVSGVAGFVAGLGLRTIRAIVQGLR